ncbi:hypothetical protein BJ944DRAFT_270138 [Cunninghamella echinulata]|nr:hypothetical protein BJ944DRAFT_270138 [Cunninghamella echinulata]
MTPISSPRLRNQDVLLADLSDLPSSPPLPSSNSPTLARPYSPFDEEMFFSRSLLMDSSPSSSPPSTTAIMATTATRSAAQAAGSTSNMDLGRDSENNNTPLVDNNYCTLVNNDRGEGPLSPSILATTNIVHSLRELATRVILNSNRNDYPLHMIPPHLAKDLTKSPRWCAHCQRAFVNEWLTSVEIKSYRGHPAVVRRVRFCSTKCWQLYLHSKKSMVCVHRAESQTIERDSADQEESEFLQASLIADDVI